MFRLRIVRLNRATMPVRHGLPINQVLIWETANGLISRTELLFLSSVGVVAYSSLCHQFSRCPFVLARAERENDYVQPRVPEAF